MSSRKRILKEYKVTQGDANILRVTLEYRKGGMNYFTSSNVERGLYLSCSPLTVNGNITSYTGFSGSAMLIRPMNRFNQKVLDTHEPTDKLQRRVIDYVIKQNNLVVEGYPEIAEKVAV